MTQTSEHASVSHHVHHPATYKFKHYSLHIDDNITFPVCDSLWTIK